MNSVPADILDRVPVLTPSDFSALMFMCVLASVAVIGIVASTIVKVHRNRLDDSLKRELLDRGMGADEIATVINAKSDRDGGLQRLRRLV